MVLVMCYSIRSTKRRVLVKYEIEAQLMKVKYVGAGQVRYKMKAI